MIYQSKILSQIGKSLYLSEAQADIHFVFTSSENQTERVPAHKLMLTASNDVFCAMFNGSWKEKNEVAIPNTSAAAFEQFLQFFYLEEVKLTADHVDELTNLGEQYNVGDCLQACSRFLEDRLNLENTCTTYNLAIVYNLDDLKRLCEAEISLNTNALLKSDGFMKCDRNVISRILQMDFLDCPETVLFHACMNWVKTKNGGALTKEAVQNHLGDLFYKIRFRSMKLDEFASIFELHYLTSLFSAEEHKDIVKMITTKDYESNIFNTSVRKDQMEPSNVVVCKRKIEDTDDEHPNEIEETELITFSVNKHVLLTKIKCFNIYEFVKYKYLNDFEEPLDSKLTITEIPDSEGGENNLTTSRVVYQNQDILINPTKDISFLKPIIIRRGMKYQVQFEQSIDYYPICTTKRYISSKVKLNDIVIEFHDEEPDDESEDDEYNFSSSHQKKGGLIASLEFMRI